MHLEWQAHYLAIGRQQTQLLWFIGCFTLSLCTSSHLTSKISLENPLFRCTMMYSWLNPWWISVAIFHRLPAVNLQSSCLIRRIRLSLGCQMPPEPYEGRLYDSHRIPHRTKVLYFTATIHLVQLPCCGRQQFQGYKNQRFDSLLNL